MISAVLKFQYTFFQSTSQIFLCFDYQNVYKFNLSDQIKMGADQSYCLQAISPLEMPTTVQQGLQLNLKTYKDHLPRSSYARKASARPILSQRVQQTLKYLLETESLKPEQIQGIQFPSFFILKKKVYYLGQWSNGLPHGKGRLYFTNGCFFQGWFYKGQAFGKDNIFIYTDGSFYRGSFKNSKKEGFGKFYYHNGFQYSGTWKQGKPHGLDCIQKYPDGSIYTGDFANGLKQGKGQYFWADGKKYTGQFKNGYMDGNGILKKGKDSYFQGQFRQNQKSGRGIMRLAYGLYQGSFRKGLMHGEGTFKWNDGRFYKGTFQNGKMHGQGTLTFTNGKSIIGQWYEGQNIQVHQIKN